MLKIVQKQLWQQQASHVQDVPQPNRDRTPASWLQPVTGTLAGLCLSLVTAGQAQAASFNFTSIANTQSGFSALSSDIALNNQGTVSFVGTDASGKAVFTGNGSTLNTVFSSANLATLFPPGGYPAQTSIDYSLGNQTAINDFNRVLFTAKQAIQFPSAGRPAFEGLFAADGSSVSQIGNSLFNFSISGYSQFEMFTRIDVGNQGDVVAATTRGAYTPRFFGGSTILVNGQAVAGGYQGPYAPNSDVFAPTINNQGIAFYASRGQAFGSGGIVQDVNTIYAVQNRVPTPIAAQPIFAETLAANDSNVVVFSGRTAPSDFDPQETGIFQVANGAITKLVDSTGNVDINNLGNIAFQINNGLFFRSQNKTHRIIGVGDQLLGSTITSLLFPSAKGLNDNGQVAFYATLANGTQGIFRADPTADVPEPGAIVGLLAFVSLGLSARAKHRQQENV